MGLPSYPCFKQEAEEEFNRRDKTLNYFSIMVNKRLKQDDESVEAAEEGVQGKSTKKKTKKDKVSPFISMIET